MPKRRRMMSTTSCEVGPAGLSMRRAPSSAENSCMKSENLFRAVECLLDGGDHLALYGKRLARNTRASRGAVSTTAEESGYFVYIDLLVFGSKADAGQFGFHFF